MLNVTIHFEPALLGLLEKAVGLLSEISAKETLVMATIDQLISDVASETTEIASVSTFIKGLQDQIKALGLPVATQAQIDQVFAAVEANKAALATAITTPPATPPPAA